MNGQRVVLSLFAFGALLGSLIYVPLNLSSRKLLVPFGVFLALGAGFTYLAGPRLLDLYFRFIGAA